ncbi:phosphatidate cytidylyltransferase [Botrytis cinerea]
MSRSFSDIPATPRVISPSPTPSELSQNGEYFGPMTRSARKRLSAQTLPIDEGIDEGETDPEDSAIELDRSRTRSRSPLKSRKAATSTVKNTKKSSKPTDNVRPEETNGTNGKASNGHLSPPAQDQAGAGETLAEALVLWDSYLFTDNGGPTVDYVRHNYPAFNGLYVRLLGAFMRETEYDGWNGVIWYLLGAWIVLGFFPKDVGVMGILLLSWCDTAASTFGRAYGRYTPRLRRGKSLAGSLAAFGVGVVTAAVFWGWLAPRTGPFPDDLDWPFMFSGDLTLPAGIRDLIGLNEAQSVISGGLALGIMSVWTGFTAAASEVVDIFGWDDNLTIPVLSGIGMWGFLKIFG